MLFLICGMLLYLHLDLFEFLDRYPSFHVQFCPYVFQGKIAPSSGRQCPSFDNYLMPFSFYKPFICAAARGKFVSGAKVLAAVPSISQPRKVYEDALETGGPGRSCQQTMKRRVLEEWFSGMVNGNLSHFCAIDNLVYMSLLFSPLRLIHVIVVQEREPRPAGSPPVFRQYTAS